MLFRTTFDLINNNKIKNIIECRRTQFCNFWIELCDSIGFKARVEVIAHLWAEIREARPTKLKPHFGNVKESLMVSTALRNLLSESEHFKKVLWLL